LLDTERYQADHEFKTHYDSKIKGKSPSVKVKDNLESFYL